MKVCVKLVVGFDCAVISLDANTYIQHEVLYFVEMMLDISNHQQLKKNSFLNMTIATKFN